MGHILCQGAEQGIFTMQLGAVPVLLQQLQSRGRTAMLDPQPAPGLPASQPQHKTTGTAAPPLLPGDATSVGIAQLLPVLWSPGGTGTHPEARRRHSIMGAPTHTMKRRLMT